MKRIYEYILKHHFESYEQMAFLSGPRQVGKTTTSKSCYQKFSYLNYDSPVAQKLIRANNVDLISELGLDKLQKEKSLVIFDELHKYNKWKSFLKGFYDDHHHKTKILVTGSARLQVYKKIGDSLLGRYLDYRMHPLSLGEIIREGIRSLEDEIVLPKRSGSSDWEQLITFGGFPDPFLTAKMPFKNRWSKQRSEILLKEDIRDITAIQDLPAIQILADILSNEVGCLVNYSKLASAINVSVDTIRRWFGVLESIYFSFTIRPYSKNIRKSLIKQPKVYLWDWSSVEDVGQKTENFIASHLLKAVHFWSDNGLGDYELFYLRDKEQREVDFLVTKNKKPWFLVEAKHGSGKTISPQLKYFQNETKANHAFQVSLTENFVDRNCFEIYEPVIVPASTFLSQLV